MGMDLKVGDKAIIVSFNSRSRYNFQKCVVEKVDRKKLFVAVSGDNFTTEFWIERNELIPLAYENYEDCIKYGVDLKGMIDLFNEYKGYYECLCRVADEISDDCNKKDDEIKSFKNKNNQLIDENAKLKEQLEYEHCKLKQISEPGELEKLRIAVDVLSCRLAECQKER